MSSSGRRSVRRRLIVLGGPWLWALGCADPAPPPPSNAEAEPPTPTAPDQSSSSAADPNAIPEDWVWVTDTQGHFEIAMPALPESAFAPPTEPGAPATRVLMATRDATTYTIAAMPATGPTALQEARGRLEAQGSVHDEIPWQKDGLSLTVDLPAGRSHIRMIVRDDRLYTLEVPDPTPPADMGRFFSSFSVRSTPRTSEIDAPKRRYRVQAPTRMGRWRDMGGIPPLIGHRAVLDGHQVAVNATELVFVPDPEAALDGSVTEMRRSMRGTLVEIDPRPFGGHPSRRVEFRASDGMYATVRVMLGGSRLFMAAVYAPSGTEAPWADAYVDSLTVE